MGRVKHFFDTYAIFELLEGNPAYQEYSSADVTITVFNLAEIYWTVLNKLGENEADEVYDYYKDAVVDIDDETMKAAMLFMKAVMHFHKSHKELDLSYADCIGYIYATRHSMRFLTGDKEFHQLEHVEFVK